ncbi:MAG: POTRA domain-containing protein, partial [Myxococcota bacterium]
MILALLALLGCAAKRTATVDARADAMVHRIAFDGNRGFLSDRTDRNLRLTMTHPQPRYGPWPVRRRVALDPERLDADRARVLTHLAHRGYFEADLDWRIAPRRPARDERPAVVDLVGEITLGPATTVAAIRVHGLDGLRPRARRRTRRVTAGRGETFTVANHEANLAALGRALQTLGHPNPQVVGEAQVRREDRSATLVYRVTPGPRAKLRDVVIDGLVDVPRDPVVRQLRLAKGDRYDVTALERARVRLYAMDVFSIVSVTPKATDDPGLVDVVVHVEERPPRGVAVRGGIEIQSGRQEALAGLQLSHLNALRRLWRLELDAEVGAAVVGSEIAQLGSLRELRVGPVADVTLGLSVPDVPARTWRTTLELGFEHTITEAFQTNRPSISAI